MSTKEKLIERFKKQPKDFTWDELVRLFEIIGFSIDYKGKTSGSRVRFKKDNYIFYFHKPHPKNIIKESVLKRAIDFLKKNDFI